jgi:hypothetical protein
LAADLGTVEVFVLVLFVFLADTAKGNLWIAIIYSEWKPQSVTRQLNFASPAHIPKPVRQ